MKVFIANPFDNLPPEGFRPQRYWLMARAFAEAGDEVTLWSADFSHAFKRPRAFPDGRAMGTGTLHAETRLTVRLVHEPDYPRNICLKRLVAHAVWARNWLKDARRQAAEHGAPDVVIVSSPPLSLGSAARTFCREFGARLVVDIQDLWPETFRRVVPAPVLYPLARLARRNYRAATAVTAVAETYLARVRDIYRVKALTHCCYLGIAHQNAGPVPMQTGSVPTQTGSVPTEKTPIRLVYAGNMSLSYDLATVVAAVSRVPDMVLDIAGRGPDEAALRQRAAACSRIRFHGYLAADALRALLSSADVGLVPMFDDSCVGVPNKLADYAAAGLRIASSLTGETADLIARYRAGTTYRASDGDDLIAAVRKAATLPRDGAAGLAALFDAATLYPAYVTFVRSI